MKASSLITIVFSLGCFGLVNIALDAKRATPPLLPIQEATNIVFE